ncbi:hypothetical protein Ddye_018041 [Dipteronia dyeriana]|uniref:RNase H type-1 domain-containing protein n=1 Tax=Dipteronia dyeriana TaxID=168575 RepID=A0AAD9X1N2_9ROSI|nr:hypothetical protein Ddye_018041 [Dipteronia dyeriana]
MVPREKIRTDCGNVLVSSYLTLRKADSMDRIDKGVMLRAAARKCWYVPPHRCFKLNVDAAMDIDGGRYGVGIVFRDDQGVVIEAVAISFSGVVSMRRLYWKVCHSAADIDNIIYDILALKRSCDIVSFDFIPRVCNSVAHSVASMFQVPDSVCSFGTGSQIINQVR